MERKAKVIWNNLKNRANRGISSRRIKRARNGSARYLGTRKKPGLARKKLNIIRVVAPTIIGLGHPKNHTKLILFLGELERAIKTARQNGSKVTICFRNTRNIEASGGIYLLARVDYLTKQYHTVKFAVIKPPKVPYGDLRAAKSIVHDVLCQIGFYRLLKVRAAKGPQLPHVDCWQVKTAVDVDAELLGNAIEKLLPLGVNGALLYRAGIEAMSNAAEHAYSGLIQTSRNFLEKRWWLFTAVMNNELIVFICDLGHGIPVTLPHTQTPNVLKTAMDKLLLNIPSQAKKSLGITDGDALQIAMSTLIKETRTALTHRGKGGKDIKSFIDANPEAQVQILSNKGFWRYKNKPRQKTSTEMGIGYNNKYSINGTIVGWSVPLTI